MKTLRAATRGRCVSAGRRASYHPDFGGVGDAAVLLKHPLVVGEQQLEAEAQRQDEGEPQQGAEDQRRQHGLALGAERDVEAAHREGGGGGMKKQSFKNVF